MRRAEFSKAEQNTVCSGGGRELNEASIV